MKQISSRHMVMLAVISLMFCAQSAFGMLPSKLAPLIGLAAKRAAGTARVGLKPLTIKNPVTAAAMRNIMTSQMPQAQCSRCTPQSPFSHLGLTNYLSRYSNLPPSQTVALLQKHNHAKISLMTTNDNHRDNTRADRNYSTFINGVIVVLGLISGAVLYKLYHYEVPTTNDKNPIDSELNKLEEMLKNILELEAQVDELTWKRPLSDIIPDTLPEFICTRILHVRLMGNTKTDKKTVIKRKIVQLQLDALEEEFARKLIGIYTFIEASLPQTNLAEQIVYLEKWHHYIYQHLPSLNLENPEMYQALRSPLDNVRKILFQYLKAYKKNLIKQLKKQVDAAETQALQVEFIQKKQEAEAEAKKQQQADTVKIAGAATAAIKFS